MKITKRQLQRIIKEELSRILNESLTAGMGGSSAGSPWSICNEKHPNHKANHESHLAFAKCMTAEKEKKKNEAITEEAPEEYRPWKEDVGDGMSELDRVIDHLMYYVDQPMQDELYETASQGLGEVISALVRLGENGYDLVKTPEQKKETSPDDQGNVGWDVEDDDQGAESNVGWDLEDY